jgi:fructose-1,6-bisphosphatase/inositol monophosphatase family enzyme
VVQFERVLDVLREAAEVHVRPRFRALKEGDIVEKSPGELVTIADREAEQFISPLLQQIRPGIPVIGEEATADNPALLDALYRGESCWLLDPIDGTNNFIAGDPGYGIAAALVERGEAVAAWIWQPDLGIGWEAIRGEGTRKNGIPVRTTPGADTIETLRGTLHSKFLPPEERSAIEAVPIRHVVAMGSMASAIDYPAIIEGEIDFIGWSRILPWDHAPGALLLNEAGGVSRRMDGSPYRADGIGFGTLAARTDATWSLARSHWPASPRPGGA